LFLDRREHNPIGVMTGSRRRLARTTCIDYSLRLVIGLNQINGLIVWALHTGNGLHVWYSSGRVREAHHGHYKALGGATRPLFVLTDVKAGVAFLRCSSCNSRHMRPSQLRLSDVPHLLILRYPVRCVLCGDRSHFGLLTVLHLRASQQRHLS
jgi:hypothetical protein